MDWQNDPELEKLFKDELDERSASLAEGAQAMMSGEVTSEIAGRMLREGHTIKGTGRVMGYEGIARGGETCEVVWRFIQQGDLETSSMLGRTLLLIAESIPPALGGDDAEVSEAIEIVRTLIVDPTMLEAIPVPLASDEPVSDETAALEAVVVEENEPPLGSIELAPEPAAEEAADEPVAEEPVTADVAESDSDDGNDDDDAFILKIHADESSDEGVGETTDTVDDEPLDEASVEASVNEAPVVETGVEHAAQAAVVPEGDPDEEPLVFEPGSNGKLATPSIAYEIVADAGAPSTPERTITAQSVPAQAADTTPLDEPPTLTVVEDARSALNPESNQAYDLGGLVGAVETWATEESVPVNAGRLFRMINDVATVRIDIDSAVNQASQVIANMPRGTTSGAIEGLYESLKAVHRASIQLESAALGLTVVPISSITSTLPQLVKYLSKKVDREVELVVEGEDTLVDRQLLDRIGEIVRQLVVNAVTHGLEPRDARVASGKASIGRVRVVASRDDQHLQIAISDDGAGIDWAAVRDKAMESDLVGDDPTADDLRSALFSDGLSTNPDSSEFTGSGSGLGRVTDIVEEVFGSMTLDSEQGRGTSFVITMPAHRALQNAQMFTAGDRIWGIPGSSVVDVVSIPDLSIAVTEKGSSISFNGESVPYASFAFVAGLEVEGLPSQVMIIQSPTGLIALAVDDVLGTHEVATKDLGPLLSGSSVVSGVALLGGDETVMLVDAGRIAERLRSTEATSDGPVHKVLVVDDSQGVRQVVSGVLASHGFSTVAAGSVSDALAALSNNTIDGLIVDFSMPRADGVALVHMVRQRYGDIPIVMLSGVASDEDRSRAERAGVDAFFDKADFAKGALVETLRGLIEAGKTNGDVRSEDSVAS
jgi:chemotaxis protein histidine kinase CheA